MNYGRGMDMDVAIIALMMEAASTSETSINFYQTTRGNNPEDSNLQNETRLNISIDPQYHI
jgi:hypothetical protein